MKLKVVSVSKRKDGYHVTLWPVKDSGFGSLKTVIQTPVELNSVFVLEPEAI